jgi:anti-anti-sigma factor
MIERPSMGRHPRGGNPLAGVVERAGPRVYRLMGELDSSNVGDVDAVLESDIPLGGDLTLDLSELTFVDSMGIGLFATAAERLAGRGNLILLSPNHSVGRLLELVQLHRRPNVKIIDADSTGGEAREEASP